jgi:hypothetical protein
VTPDLPEYAYYCFDCGRTVWQGYAAEQPHSDFEVLAQLPGGKGPTHVFHAGSPEDAKAKAQRVFASGMYAFVSWR